MDTHHRASGYALLVAALALGEHSMLYHPIATRISPAQAGLPQAEEVVLDTSDGEKPVARHVPAQWELRVQNCRIFQTANPSTVVSI